MEAWNKTEQIFFFFFRSRITVLAGQRGRSCYFHILTWPFSLSYLHVMYHITRPELERFQNGRWLSVKKFVENLFFLISFKIF